MDSGLRCRTGATWSHVARRLPCAVPEQGGAPLGWQRGSTPPASPDAVMGGVAGYDLRASIPSGGRVAARVMGCEKLGRGDLDEAGKGIGEGDGGELAVRVLGDAGNDETANGDFLARAGVDACHADLVGDGAGAFLGDEEVKLDGVLEAEGAAVVAGGMDAWEAEGGGGVGKDDGMAKGAEEGVLDELHVPEELGKMNNAGHVGFVELDKPGCLELEGHGGKRAGVVSHQSLVLG